jgi:multidrug efflux pump subunit AcrB
VLSTYFFRNPRLTLLLVGFIVIAGASAFSAVPRQEDPVLPERWGRIVTLLPGASAGRVEALVTEKVENVLREIEEIKLISSVSQTGWSAVNVQLDDDITDVDSVWARVRDRLSQVQTQLPPPARVPDLEQKTTTAFTMLIGFSWTLDDTPQMDLMKRIAQELRQRLIISPGTEAVELFGEPTEEVQVTIDADALASVGLSIPEISRAIRRADAKNAAGRIDSARNIVVVEVRGELDSVSRIRSIPLVTRADGRIMRLGDLAEVAKMPRTPRDTLALIDGRPGIIVGARMEGDRRVDQWADAARKRMEAFAATLPLGVKTEVIFDQSVHTEARLQGLTGNLLLGAALVLLVLLVMMGWRSAVVVASALPLTLLSVLVVMNAAAIALQQVSLTGLIVAVGLLIDNAIVVVDQYNKQRQAGLAPGEAMAVSERKLFRPLLASNLTTTLTFLPLVLMPGNAGEFMSTLGITVILAVNFSLLLSLTVVPAVAGYLDHGRRLPPGRGVLTSGLGGGAFSSPYRALLRAAIRRPLFGIGLALVLPVAGFLVGGQLVEQLFPPADREQFQVQIKLPPQASLAETRGTVERVRQLIHAHPEVRRSHWFIGEEPPRVYYNTAISEDAAPDFAFGFVDTHSAAGTHALLPRLQDELLDAFPNAQVLTLPFEQGPPIEAPIELRIYGPDLDVLRALGEEVRLILSRSRNVTYTEASISSARPVLALMPDETQLQRVGMTPTDLAAQLDAGLSGVTGGSVLEGTEELPVRVRLAEADRSDLARVLQQRVLSMDPPVAVGEDSVSGAPLLQLASTEVEPDVNLIYRRQGERANVVSAFLEPFSLPGEALMDFRERLADSGFVVPPGYRIEYGGDSEGSGEARTALLSVLAPLLVVMIATVVLAFDSFRMAAIIGLVAVFSVGCAILSLWFFGFAMGFMAIIGAMGLLGVAINDSIVVLSDLHSKTACRSGDERAIRDCVLGATRHIVSTTLTTIGGFLPLIIFGGLFWPPLAVAVAGGMIGATLLALFFVPPMFTMMMRGSAARSGRQASINPRHPE